MTSNERDDIALMLDAIRRELSHLSTVEVRVHRRRNEAAHVALRDARWLVDCRDADGDKSS